VAGHRNQSRQLTLTSPNSLKGKGVTDTPFFFDKTNISISDEDFSS